MKSKAAILVLLIILAGCSVPLTPAGVPDTAGKEPAADRFSIIDPRDCPVITAPTGEKIIFSKLSNKEINDLLPLEQSVVTILKTTAEGNVGFTSAKFTAEAGRYKILLDYIKFRDETLRNSGKSYRVGVGIRITADVTTSKANLDLGSLFAIGMQAKQGNLSGQIEVLKIGIDSSKISILMPPPMEINDSSMQNALQAVAAIRAKLYDSDTKLTPHMIAEKAEPSDGPENEGGDKNKVVLNSYFSDLDGKKEYVSSNGVVEFKTAKDNSLRGATTVNDLMVNGKLDKFVWKVAGYKRDNYLYLSYGAGVAVLKYHNDDYVGYWIGENSEGALMKCPYVLSKDRLTDKQAKKRWSVFEQNCYQWNIIENKLVKPN